MSGFGSGGGFSYRPRPGVSVRFGPQGPVPPVVKGLILASFLVFVVQILTGPWLVQNFGLSPAKFYSGAIWQLLTYQFLHGGVMHLAMNCFMLWMFGAELESRWGPRFFLRYFLLCGAAGGLTFVLASPEPYIPAVGASGAIYGVLMAYGLWFPTRVVLFALIFPVQVRYLVIFLIAMEFLQTLEQPGSGIAHGAHLGGMVFGYFYLRWGGAAGLGLAKPMPFLEDLRRKYRRRKLRKKQDDRFRGGPTLH